MISKIQCPKCLKKLQVTEEQYLKYKGKMRCRTCRVTFDAVLLPQDKPTPDVKTTPINTDDNSIKNNTLKQDSLPTQLVLPEITSAQQYKSNADQIAGKSSELAKRPRPEQKQNQRPEQAQDQNLIAKVDQLIDEKLISKTQNNAATEAALDETLVLKKGALSISASYPISNRSGLGRWLLSFFFGLFALALLAGLFYQLWLRQAIPILEHEPIAPLLVPVSTHLNKLLSAHFDLNLPIRRDLKNLTILSASTEAHPSRSSTILLRVGIVNRAAISQPFPWLELSLSDENGRLVSRRALPPDDYLHKNRLDNLIMANEIRQVTIELLSFPDAVHGFELKLLDK